MQSKPDMYELYTVTTSEVKGLYLVRCTLLYTCSGPGAGGGHPVTVEMYVLQWVTVTPEW